MSANAFRPFYKDSAGVYRDSTHNRPWETQEPHPDTIIHDNQAETAQNIVGILCSKETRSRHVMLMAQMQAGKTGVISALAYGVRNNPVLHDGLKYLGIEEVIIITGMSDKGLRSQIVHRLQKQARYTEDDANGCVRTNPGMQYENKLGPLGKPVNKLIIIDESHYGNKEDYHQLPKFLANIGINQLNDDKVLAEANAYIVSVSATPFSELFFDQPLGSKQRVILQEGDNYFGASYFRKPTTIDETGVPLLRHSMDLLRDDDLHVELDRQYSRMQYAATKEKFYGCGVMIRCKDDERIASLKKKYDDKWQIVEVTTSINASIDYNSIERAFDLDDKKRPSVWMPYLFIIKGAYRAGHTIPERIKHRIFMVADTPRQAVSESALQSLFGRICGYFKSKPRTTIFTSVTAVHEYAEWVEHKYHASKLPSYRQPNGSSDDKAFDPYYQMADESLYLQHQLLDDDDLHLWNRLYRIKMDVKERARKLTEYLYSKYKPEAAAAIKASGSKNFMQDRELFANIYTNPAQIIQKGYSRGIVNRDGISKSMPTVRFEDRQKLIEEAKAGVEFSVDKGKYVGAYVATPLIDEPAHDGKFYAYIKVAKLYDRKEGLALAKKLKKDAQKRPGSSLFKRD